MGDEEILSLAQRVGFEHYGMMDVSKLCFQQEVRDMCRTGRCDSYGKCWTCPPACGTLEEAAERAGRYRRGILLQTTGQMEDDFDFETMMEAEQLQKQRFFRFVEEVRREYPDCLPMATGRCTICEQCAYPDGPCRIPERAVPSMEAYGLLVSKTCADSGVTYYYGPRTITYTACVLF